MQPVIVGFFKGSKDDYIQVCANVRYTDKLKSDGWVMSIDELDEVKQDGQSRRGRKPRSKPDSDSAE